MAETFERGYLLLGEQSNALNSAAPLFGVGWSVWLGIVSRTSLSPPAKHVVKFSNGLPVPSNDCVHERSKRDCIKNIGWYLEPLGTYAQRSP